ncbi:hypothetical protein BWK59_06435 [Flavobacterium davisii]|uniref:Uncharacterized protein n=1 Tax=Flavobacterium davisii TaxID=2906077 RepID=A0A246GKV1_9FLAO|nr:hypothetical protein [Flavobacterium davisii]OWP84224.1 hypothetical protein BWK59_06435 [Flavobacterium davisii]
MATQTRAQEYFQNTPDVTKVYETSDGFVFDWMPNAIAHANTLDDKQVLTLGKDGDLISEDVDGLENLTETQIEILKNGLDKKNYNSIKEIVKALNIETTDPKAETLIKALEEYKQNLNK